MGCCELNFPADGRPTPAVVARMPGTAPPGRTRLWRARIVGWGLVLSLCATAPIAWYAGLRYRFVPFNFGVVEPGKLFRSGQISRHVIRKTLVGNSIGLIVDLSSRWEDTPDARAERSVAAELGVRRLNLTLRGNGVGDPAVYPQVIAAIVEANRGGRAALVHCQSGAQRTGGVIAAYRILVDGTAPAAAFAEMRCYGHDPVDNPHLIPFIESHLPQWRSQLAAEHIVNAPAATDRAR